MTLRASDWITALKDGTDINDCLDLLEEQRKPKMKSFQTKTKVKWEANRRLPRVGLYAQSHESTSTYPWGGLSHDEIVEEPKKQSLVATLNNDGSVSHLPYAAGQVLYGHTDPKISQLMAKSRDPLATQEARQFHEWFQRRLEKCADRVFDTLEYRDKQATKWSKRRKKLEGIIKGIEDKIRKYRDDPNGRPPWFGKRYPQWLERLQRYEKYRRKAEDRELDYEMFPLGHGYQAYLDKFECRKFDLLSRHAAYERRTCLREAQKLKGTTFLPVVHVKISTDVPMLRVESDYQFHDKGHFDGQSFVDWFVDSSYRLELPMWGFDETLRTYVSRPLEVAENYDFVVDKVKLADAVESIRLAHDEDFASFLVDVKEFPGLVSGFVTAGRQLKKLLDLVVGEEIMGNQSLLKTLAFTLGRGQSGFMRRPGFGKKILPGQAPIRWTIPETDIRWWKPNVKPISWGGLADVLKFLALADLNRMYGLSDSIRAALAQIKEFLDDWSEVGSRLSKLLDRNGKTKIYHRGIASGVDESVRRIPLSMLLENIEEMIEQNRTGDKSKPFGTVNEGGMGDRKTYALQQLMGQLGSFEEPIVEEVTTTSYRQNLTVLGSMTIETPWGTQMSDDAIVYGYMADLFGLNFNPKALWDATPWTFVVDYVFDVGQWLDDHFHLRWLNGSTKFFEACITHNETKVVSYRVYNGVQKKDYASASGDSESHQSITCKVVGGPTTRKRFVRKLVDPESLLKLRNDPTWVDYVGRPTWAKLQSISDLLLSGAASHGTDIRKVWRDVTQDDPSDSF